MLTTVARFAFLLLLMASVALYGGTQPGTQYWLEWTLIGITGVYAMGRAIRNAPCNGWEHWYYDDADSGERLPIDRLRARLRNDGRGARAADLSSTALFPHAKATSRASKINK